MSNELDCTDSHNITFTNDCPSEMYLPNTFSPNGDGQNDFFQTYGLEIVNFNLKNFDRWKAFLFESCDLEKGWNGKSDGKNYSIGIYAYVVEATFLRGGKVLRKGGFTLLT